MDPHLEAWIESGGDPAAWYEHRINELEQERDHYMKVARALDTLHALDAMTPANPYEGFEDK